MTEKTITLEAKGEFPFTFYIEKAIAAEQTEKEYILEGVASTANIDHDNERMSKEALEAMANKINSEGVPLRIEHSKSNNAIVGRVFKAWVDERNQMHIRTALDKSHPVAEPLFRAMKEEGKKMGFSVGGMVTRAMREFSEAAGKLVKTFYDVDLKEVSVTPRPANYDSWAVAKHIAPSEVEAEFSKSIFYEEFLNENPQMDYLQVFAKSVPSDAWSKVETTINKHETIMTKENEKDEETTKGVSRQEFGVVVKGIETLTKAFEAMVGVMKKSGDGMSSAPKDTTSPDKKKPEDESPAAKSSDKEDETKEKSSDKEDETKEKSSDKEDETKEKSGKKDDEYDIETISRSISSLHSIIKTMEETAEDKKKEKSSDEKDETKEKSSDKEDETKEKSADESEEETKKYGKEETTEKAAHPLDVFVFTVTKAIESMAKKMNDSGVNLIGFEKHQVEKIVNDSVMQEAIKKMMKIPGAKKSMSLGVPYMVTKSGKRYGLVAQEVGAPTIEKSQKTEGKKDFKSVYKADFSSIREEDEG